MCLFAGGVQAMLDAGFDRPDAQAGVPEDLLVPSTSAPSAAPQDRSLITLFVRPLDYDIIVYHISSI